MLDPTACAAVASVKLVAAAWAAVVVAAVSVPDPADLAIPTLVLVCVPSKAVDSAMDVDSELETAMVVMSGPTITFAGWMHHKRQSIGCIKHSRTCI